MAFLGLTLQLFAAAVECAVPKRICLSFSAEDSGRYSPRHREQNGRATALFVLRLAWQAIRLPYNRRLFPSNWI